MKKFFTVTILLLTLGAGCTSNLTPGGTTTTPTPTTTSAATSTLVTYYVSNAQSVKYCNGADMDSTGYKQTVNQKVTSQVVGQLSTEEKIKQTLAAAVAASEFKDSPYTRVASTTFDSGTVTLYPGLGWAGSSIFMCAWQPFVEKQLEQFPEVKQIKWSEATNY